MAMAQIALSNFGNQFVPINVQPWPGHLQPVTLFKAIYQQFIPILFTAENVQPPTMTPSLPDYPAQ